MAFAIRFLPDRRLWTGDEAVDLALAAAECDILLEALCGSKGTCGKCRIRVVEGEVAPGAADLRVLGAEAVAAGWRLGCTLRVACDATVEIPRPARAVAHKTFGEAELVADGFEPAIRKVRVCVPEPDPAGPAAVLERLAEVLGTDATALDPPAAALRRLASALERGAEVCAVLDEGKLITVEDADSPAAAWGMAIDVGTTTVAAALVDLASGRAAAMASAPNPQAQFGADVISRIRFADTQPDGLERLRGALVSVLDRLIAVCLQTGGGTWEQVYGVCCVGNPTMIHTLVGVHPGGLGRAPYAGIWRGAWRGTAQGLGLDLPACARAYLPPGVHSHVGADTVAALVATGLDRAARPTLFIDLGTNSEVALASRDAVVCTSTAAGPAFEGATIHQGMRGAPGAIDQVRLGRSGTLAVHVIGGGEPAGICGSGLVDAVAELLRGGVVEPSGRMRSADEVAASGPALAPRIEEPDGVGRALWLAGSGNRKIYLSGGDVRQLQLVKGSILAGSRILLTHCGLTPEDLDAILIAGAFGNYLRVTSALGIGLVPAVDPERIRFIGDAAGAGARLLLVDRGARRRAERLAAEAEYVELAGRADYAEAFVAALPFPEDPQGGR